MGLVSKLVSNMKKVTSNIIKNTPILNNIAPKVISSVTAPSTQTKSPAANVALKATAIITAPSTVSLAKSATIASVASAGAAAALLNPASTVSLVKAAVPKTVAGKAAAVIAAPAAVTLVASSPKLQGDLLNIPAASSEFGKDIAKVYENPSLETTKDLIIDHPIATTLAGATALTAVGLGVKAAVPTVLGVANNAATKENTKALEAGNNLLKSTPVVSTPQAIPVKTEVPKSSSIPTSSNVPLTPATQVIGKSVSSTKKTKKRRTKPKNNTPLFRVTINNQTKTLNTYTHRRVCYG